MILRSVGIQEKMQSANFLKGRGCRISAERLPSLKALHKAF